MYVPTRPALLLLLMFSQLLVLTHMLPVKPMVLGLDENTLAVELRFVKDMSMIAFVALLMSALMYDSRLDEYSVIIS